jgi:Predicted membrane protein, putative toxin regulator
MKKILKRIFIDAMGGMTLGLFATLIVGTIIQQIALFFDGDIAFYIDAIGKIAASLTGAGIGIGVAYRLKASPLVIFSAAAVGMVGAFASPLLNGGVITQGGVLLSGPGEPLGAFIAAYIAVELGLLIAGKTSVDILVTPLVTIFSGAAMGLLVGKPIGSMLAWLRETITWTMGQQPLISAMIISVLMGMILTLPISSAAIGIILNLSGAAAGAATIGCCCNMVGFAVASYRENKVQGLIAQGVGTSMLQMPNIVKNFKIWIPAIVASAILGPIGTLGFQMTNNATGSGMGTAGFVGQIMTWQTMSVSESGAIVFLKIAFIHFIFPAIIALIVSELMRKKNWIKAGDMKLEI